jgi:hypothetical protein
LLSNFNLCRYSSETEMTTELWTLQMAGLDAGGPGSPPATPSRLKVFMTPASAAEATAELPPGYAYKPVSPKKT